MQHLKDGAFKSITKNIKIESFTLNTLLPTGISFISTCLWVLKSHDDMTPKSSKEYFKELFKLYNDLKAAFKLTLREKEKILLFCNTFSADHHNIFVQQEKVPQDENSEVCWVLPDLLFNWPPPLQTMQMLGIKKHDCKEVNQKNNHTKTSHAAAWCKTSLNTHANIHEKKILVIHARVISVLPFCNPVLIDLEPPRLALQLIALKTKPF